MKKIKAIALLSGGLDSALAAKLMVDQGIEVIGLFLSSPFACTENVEGVAKNLGIPLKVVDKGMAFIDLIRDPKYGYGKNLNPCIDCRIYMFGIATRIMEEEGADFIVTGEVLGQRPMSQRREAMDIIDRDSETKGLILRPLSALHNAPTLPELEGWVDRSKLLDISGRGRSQQLAWAKSLNLKEFTAPGGGCLLTDAGFSKRLATFLEKNKNPRMIEVQLVRYGRHFDLSDGSYVVVGRDEKENDILQSLTQSEVEAGKMILFRPFFSAPLAILVGENVAPAIYEEVGQYISKYAKKSLRAEQLVEVKTKASTSHMTVFFPEQTTEEPQPLAML